MDDVQLLAHTIETMEMMVADIVALRSQVAERDALIKSMVASRWSGVIRVAGGRCEYCNKLMREDGSLAHAEGCKILEGRRLVGVPEGGV